MYTAMFLSGMLVVAAPVPEFKLTAEERAAVKELEPFGIKAMKEEGIDLPYGTLLMYFPQLGYDRKQGKLIMARMPTEKDLAPLAKLNRLRRICFPGAPFVNDTMLGLLRDMHHLRHLDLRQTKITDQGLKKLAKLRSLSGLYLDETNITDDGLKTLAEYPALFELDLPRTKVTDRGLAALEKNHPLRVLRLGENPGITDGGIASLGKMPNLITLWLNETGVTDKGFAEMAKPGAFPKLTWLRLADKAVTGKGLEVLHDPKVLPSLKRLYIESNNVTEDDIKALRKKRPGVEIR